MINHSKKDRLLTISQNRSVIKVTILLVSAIIGFGSILYTNLIVEELKEREQRLIELYANTLEYTVSDNSSDNLVFIFQEIIVSNNSIPVILTDINGQPTIYRNINMEASLSENRKATILMRELEEMKQEHEPIIVEMRNEDGDIFDYNYVYYKNSFLLNQLRFYPYVQLSVIAGFGLLAYLIFSYSRTAEQNRVWVGLAKETAHQLGTPLSSLMAWTEYFKADPEFKNKSIVDELNKDIQKLETITARFSNIGSVPILKEEVIGQVVRETVSYLQPRISTKVIFKIYEAESPMKVHINKPLFEWVIENLSKNAVDAMGGRGTIYINMMRENQKIIIDITDTGKGIPKKKLKQVFQPGFTTKKRGWGLGLTLVKRIVEHYHKGKIFVKSSEIDKGTTFRIILKA